MSELTLAYKVRSYSTGTLGRAICNARTHHFVADDAGGEEVGAGELFLSGIAACDVNMVERLANEGHIDLDWMDVGAEAWRDPINPPETSQSTKPYGSISRCGEWTTIKPTNWWRPGSAVDRCTVRSPWRPQIPRWNLLPTRSGGGSANAFCSIARLS